MIVATNPKPSLEEFKELIQRMDDILNADAAKRGDYYVARGGLQLESDVWAAAVESAKHTTFEGAIQLVSGASFPDIVASRYYGIEVKSSKGNNWRSIGSSILESTRIADVERIFLTFGKLSDPVGFRSRPYEECMSGIAVTHYPRYQIDMNLREGETIFDKMGCPYDKLRTMENPVTPVAEYYKSQLRQGEALWWAGGRTDTAIPATVRLWRTLSSVEKDELEATIYVLFPETILSRSQFKYDRATLWLATENGIINANVRDSFSSGGKEWMTTADGSRVLMPAVFRKIAEHKELFKNTLRECAEDVLVENWGGETTNDRGRRWIELVVSHTNDPIMRRDARKVLEFIFTECGIIE